MDLFASIVAFFLFLAGCVVLVPAIGMDGSIGFLSRNLATTICWTSGFLALAGRDWASRRQGR